MNRFLFLILLFPILSLADSPLQVSSLNDLAKRNFIKFASQIPTDAIARLPVQSNGRIKPFDSLARETAMYLTGSRSPMGLHPIQFYLGLITYEGNTALEVVEVRNKELRVDWGYPKNKRYFTIPELEKTGLQAQAQPLMAKEEANGRSLSSKEKDVLEVLHQVFLAKDIMSGSHFLGSVDFTPLMGNQNNQSFSSETIELGRKYLDAVSKMPESSSVSARELTASALAQPVPKIFEGYRNKINLEVRYNQFRPFLWSGILYFCFGLVLLFGFVKNVKPAFLIAAYSLPLILHIGGFFTRVYITGFAPVTNMYTTMLWVSFGVSLFSIILFILYRNQKMVGLLLLGSSLVLLLTENFPLILSPDMDPIVAVLRSNYWLTLHVLTITISYSAFTICMLIGNYALIRTVFSKQREEFYKTYAHYAYRMAQLGVCLITAGIILGGIWADYSWGRFWGWDPKETWALIADMGFIVILHARYIGWLRSFGTLMAVPVAYLLVIMAWYGVNFILAAGLHSYGFSSGGATFVGVFVSLQLIILAAAALTYRKR